jgi:hypothetical protein
LDEDGDVEKILDLGCWILDFQSGADEGAEAVGFGGVVGAGGTVDAHVVGEGDGIVAELGGPADKVLGLAGAAEEGEGGSAVEFGEDAICYC